MKVSQGNSKLGKIPNVSLIPVKDCPPICKTSCSKQCYALKALKAYPNVRKAWFENSHELRKDIHKWFTELDAYLDKKKPAFFRFHVAGDILDREHFRHIRTTARQHPKTKFLVFTKNYNAVHGRLPKNLSVVLSVWQGSYHPIPRRLQHYPRAYAGHCARHKRFNNALVCPGKCDTCGACWDLAKHKIDVRFNLH